jgi:hypothetical protein
MVVTTPICVLSPNNCYQPCAVTVATIASMTTLVPIMGGYFLLLLHPCCCCSTSLRLIFPKEGNGRGVSSWRKV